MNISLIAMLIMTSGPYLNLTDWLIDTFGIGVMNALWTPLMMLFDALEAFFGVDLTPLWERLFA